MESYLVIWLLGMCLPQASINPPCCTLRWGFFWFFCENPSWDYWFYVLIQIRRFQAGHNVQMWVDVWHFSVHMNCMLCYHALIAVYIHWFHVFISHLIPTHCYWLKPVSLWPCPLLFVRVSSSWPLPSSLCPLEESHLSPNQAMSIPILNFLHFCVKFSPLCPEAIRPWINILL